MRIADRMTRATGLLLLLTAIGCGPASVPTDAGDASVDGATADAGVDGGTDAASDGGTDATLDAGPVHDPIAPGITGPLGSPLPSATPTQLAAFERGRALFLRERTVLDGLGPQYSGVSCVHCHERPTTGGSAGLYRNAYFSGAETMPGRFDFSGFHHESEDVGSSAGLVRLYRIPGAPAHARSPLASDVAILVARNPPALFGAGLVLAVDEATIRSHEDPDDADGDGISGRVNVDRGRVGRFGSQAIAAGLFDFMHVEVFLQLGVTVELPSDAQRAGLPFPDPTLEGSGVFVPDPADPIPDPEMTNSDFTDLVTFVQLLAGPELTPLDATSARGRDVFASLGCESCHIPRMASAVGPLPLYSDLLLHDMGSLGDELAVEDARAHELKTAPLWGVVALGPYLHDGRALTLDEAILGHDGEGRAARVAYAAAPAGDRDALLAFLATLGGADVATPGRLPPDAPVLGVGELGGPSHALDAAERATFVHGRSEFDRLIGLSEGLGGPAFNGDSCHACHFDPVIGGAGSLDVDVVRQSFADGSGVLHVPASGDVAFRERLLSSAPDMPPSDANVQEHRQTPPLFGMALLDGISDAEILSREDPDDLLSPDGISGRAGRTLGAGIGRFGWKASVPHLHDFVRDAISVEMGLTLAADGAFGRTVDGDTIADPEASPTFVADIESFVSTLAPPPRGPIDATTMLGETLFASVGCADCHAPTLMGVSGPVHAYTDLLLHDVAEPAAPGIEEGSASAHEYRTAPLWGAVHSAPYMHSGEAPTFEAAIALHAGEASATTTRFTALSATDRAALLAFLASL